MQIKITQVKPGIVLALCAALLALGGCTNPSAPDPERPPEPKAVGQSAASRAIHEPLDRAKAVEDASRQAAEAQRQAIEAVGG